MQLVLIKSTYYTNMLFAFILYDFVSNKANEIKMTKKFSANS